jgi:hypothetical protein
MPGTKSDSVTIRTIYSIKTRDIHGYMLKHRYRRDNTTDNYLYRNKSVSSISILAMDGRIHVN